MSEIMKPCNVIAIDGAATPDKLADLVRTLKHDLPNLIVVQELQAQVIRARFVALVDAGFSVAEALELCK